MISLGTFVYRFLRGPKCFLDFLIGVFEGDGYMLSHRRYCKCHNTLVVVIEKGFVTVVGFFFEILLIWLLKGREEGILVPNC